MYGRRLNLTLESLYFRSFRTFLQSHPLWVTLYEPGQHSLQAVKTSKQKKIVYGTKMGSVIYWD